MLCGQRSYKATNAPVVVQATATYHHNLMLPLAGGCLAHFCGNRASRSGLNLQVLASVLTHPMHGWRVDSVTC